MHWFKERCNYLSFIHSLFLKQPRHNTRTEKTKTINYLQYMYIQDTKDILGKLHARRTNIIFLLSLIWHQIRQFYPVMSITEKNLCAFDKKWVDMEFHTSKFYGNLFFQKFFLWIISTCKKNQENWQPLSCRTNITVLTSSWKLDLFIIIIF